MAKLSKAQRRALGELASRDKEWLYYIDKRAGEALLRRGLVDARGFIGDHWHSREYRITDAGREALAAIEQEGGHE